MKLSMRIQEEEDEVLVKDTRPHVIHHEPEAEKPVEKGNDTAQCTGKN